MKKLPNSPPKLATPIEMKISCRTTAAVRDQGLSRSKPNPMFTDQITIAVMIPKRVTPVETEEMFPEIIC